MRARNPNNIDILLRVPLLAGPLQRKLSLNQMEGFYLYCIRRRVDTPFSFSTKGIDEKRRVLVFRYCELEAVVSKVSLQEFDSEAIRIRAQNDLKWIKEKAITHEKVIEEAMRKNVEPAESGHGWSETLSLIPLKFGTIFKGEEALKETLTRHYEPFKATLERLEGKEEWSAKVYLTDTKKIEQMIKEESEVIREGEKEMASLPEGMAYFIEKELEELLLKERDRELRKVQKEFFERLKTYAEEAREGRILEKEFTGRLEPMVLNASYLIRKERIEDFKLEADRIGEQLTRKGLSLELSGPWPPYNFVS